MVNTLIISLLTLMAAVTSGLWQPSSVVYPEEVTDLDEWFVAEPIDDGVFARMKGKSYKIDCTIPRDSLRYLKLLYVDSQGTARRGEMVCNVAIAEDLIDIFRQLYESRYPIERMELIDNYGADDIRSMKANNTSAFNFRYVAHTRKLSNHSCGMAVDLNPLYNPYVKRRKDGTLLVSPEEGRPYAERAGDFPYKITPDDLACRLFKAHGFKWGGEWKTLKDYQHFEK